jgi:S-DNA-T family DNA segregation ATPase FtsK/SpoIIIE
LDWNSDSKKNSVFVADYFSLVALSVSIIVCLALFSFNPKDSSSFHLVLTSAVPKGSTHHNLLGAYGANLAEWLIQFIGMGAYILGAVLVIHSLQLFQRPRVRPRWALRIFGYPQFFICLLGLMASFRESISLLGVLFPVSGWVGMKAHETLIPVLGPAGVRIVFAAGVLSSLPLCLGVNPVMPVVWLLGRLPWRRFKDLAVEASASQPQSHSVDVRPTTAIAGKHVQAQAQAIQNSDGVGHIKKAESPTLEVRSQPIRNTDDRKAHASEERPATQRSVPRVSSEGVPAEVFDSLLNLLPRGQLSQGDSISVQKNLESQGQLLTSKLSTFGVTGRVVRSQPGPVVNVHEFEPAAGIKVTKVLSLQDDLALGLKAQSVLMAPQPGKSTIGIEVPATIRDTVAMRDVMEHSHFRDGNSPLPIALGKNVDGSPLVADLSGMPHLLIAGATGSGKSVGINTILLSLMMARTPEQVRFILVDPKMLELSNYDGIGHLLMPVVTDPSKAAGALKWAIDEMDRRYTLMRRAAVRNIAAFNHEVSSHRLTAEQLAGETPVVLPYIVVVIDELCDLMMTAPRDIEDSIQRLAQKARAAGIHLILATQRPSVDVITGVIKANLPCRISFQVASKHDSRTIIECVGAERLLGKGDLLFLPPGTNRIVRGHGAYIGDREINALSQKLSALYPQRYDQETMAAVQKNAQQISQKNDNAMGGKIDESGVDGTQMDENDLYDRAIDFAVSSGTVSTSSLQRNFRIGYNKAARLMDRMVKDGLVGPSDVAGKPRQVLSSERGTMIQT